MKQPKETLLVSACLVWLRMQGCKVWKNNVGGMAIHQIGRRSRFVRFGEPGLPDIIGIAKNGRFVGIECKRKPNKLTEHQIRFLDSARSMGAWAIYVYSVDELEEAWKREFV